VVAGLAGVEAKLAPPPADDAPYEAERPLLPRSLMAAVDALEKDALFRQQFGNVFVDYFVALKRNEIARYLRSLEGAAPPGDEPTEWEQNEYFDFF
jgi:glutamine synthetase